jgi:hypothetical protein
VEALADEIAGPGANAEIRQLAFRIANRFATRRHARHQFLSDNLNDIHNDSGPNMRKNEEKAVIGKFPRSYLSQLSMDAPQKSATIVSQEAKQLVAMDGYERRALSRPLPLENSTRGAESSTCASEMISKLLQWDQT